MKVIKGLILFCFLGASVSACFEPPEFSNTPEISYRKIQFKETPSAGDYDTLVLTLNFRDGDGDLGLDDNYLEEPFNDSYYYLATGVGDTTRIATQIVYTTSPPYNSYIMLTSPITNLTGKLVTDRTRQNPLYNYLPVYNENSCLNYSYSEILVPEKFEAVDNTYNITDTLYISTTEFYVVEEALLFKKNRYHNNIEVKFWVLENGTFVEYDWYANFCITFNGRFPVLGNERRPLEGTIRYAMANPSFLSVFSVKTLKLSIVIRDRALNTSKEIFTPQFTLSQISN